MVPGAFRLDHDVLNLPADGALVSSSLLVVSDLTHCRLHVCHDDSGFSSENLAEKYWRMERQNLFFKNLNSLEFR